MNRAHDLAATRGNAIPYQETIEIDAFIAQRIAFVHRDHNRRHSAHLFGLGERGPRKWVSRFICFNAVTHGVDIVVHATENYFVLDSGRTFCARPNYATDRAQSITDRNRVGEGKGETG